MGDKKQPVTIYLSSEDRKKLEHLAKQEDRTLSYYMRQIIAEHLRRKRARTPTPTGDKP